MISAFQSKFNTLSERGQHQGSCGDDKYNDKDNYRQIQRQVQGQRQS